jgi:mannose-6-phosphate isomerase
MDAIPALSRFARELLVPLSRDRFADSVHGGFHERLDAARNPVATGRKRLMVQARQLYLLSHAALLGDRSGAQAVEHGYNFLLRTYRDLRHGGWHFSATPSGEVLDPSKDLYGHAFLLFALAWLHRAFAVPGTVIPSRDRYAARVLRW